MKIEIPKELWVVKKNDSNLAYVTYKEDNAAFTKRQGTGRHWATGRYYKGEEPKETPEFTYKNELTAGYKILDNISRWTTSNVVWRVLDPRGFEFEIYSGNMMEILKCSRVEKGIILDPCIIGREGGKNVLLPEGSEPYLNAKNYTELKDAAKETKLKIKDVTPGSLVTLKDGNSYTYLGAFYPIHKKETSSENDKVVTFEVKDKHYYFSYTTDNGNTAICSYKSPMVINVEPKETTEDLRQVIYSDLPYGIFGVLRNKKEEFKLSLVPPKGDSTYNSSRNTHIYGSCIIQACHSYIAREENVSVTRVNIEGNTIHFPNYYEMQTTWSWVLRKAAKKPSVLPKSQVDTSLVQELVMQIDNQNIPLRYIY